MKEIITQVFLVLNVVIAVMNIVLGNTDKAILAVCVSILIIVASN